MVAAKEEWTEIWGRYDIAQALNVLMVDNVVLEVIPLISSIIPRISQDRLEPGVLVRFVSRRELTVDTFIG